MELLYVMEKNVNGRLKILEEDVIKDLYNFYGIIINNKLCNYV
jgi:hypothetical protein